MFVRWGNRKGWGRTSGTECANEKIATGYSEDAKEIRKVKKRKRGDYHVKVYWL